MGSNMKYVGDQITVVRRDTRNEDVPTAASQVGIETADILRYLNYAQERLQSLILVSSPQTFQAEKIISLVIDQEAYTISDRVFAGERIVNVEYSPTGDISNYYEIFERALSYRNTYNQTNPTFYIRRNGQILLNPIPNQATGKIRVTYERQLDTTDIRRGQIDVITLSSTQLTALTLDIATDDDVALEAAQYLCINDKYGTVKMYNIPITSYNDTTGVVTLPAFTFASGETGAVDNYVTVGQYTTTHSKLHDICERYLETYAAMKVFKRDSSSDAADFARDLDAMESDIIRTYQEADKDEKDIQISNESLMLGGWGV